MTVDVITFGCRLNTYESSIIKEKAISAGLTGTFIINSCAVTSESERQLRQSIRKIKKNNPDAKVIVTGCAAQTNPDYYSNMSEVDMVVGNVEKLNAETYSQIAASENTTSKALQLVSNIMEVQKLEAQPTIGGFEGKTRGYLQVQTGCNHRCTFCIIPYGRGNNRSAPFGAILKQAQTLMDQGYNELVITGVDITDYGLDIPGKPSLGQLVKRLLKNLPELKRLRLSSIDVAEIDNDLLDVIANEPRLMPHLHLSMQSGDNMILKRMKRRHTREQIIEFCKKTLELRPNIAFGADIIAGFPTETDEMFSNTYELLQEVQKIVHLHIFPYSERSGTPAARMPQVNKSIRKQRATSLRKLGNQLLHQHMKSQIGKRIKILMETHNIGRAEDFCLVDVKQQCEKGKIYDCLVEDIDAGKIVANLVK